MSFQDDDVIERSPHDKEHPFTMVSNALIRDKNITPNCRWMLIFLLSSLGKWKIKVDTIINHVKGQIGRDSVYKLFEEAIKAGYLYRHEWLEGGKKRYKYYLSETKDFQNISQFPERQETAAQDTASQDTLRINSKKKELKEEQSIDPPTSLKPEPEPNKVFTWIDRLKEELKATDEEMLEAAEIMETAEKRTGEARTNRKEYMRTVIENMRDDREALEALKASAPKASEQREPTQEEIEASTKRLMEYLDVYV